MPYTIYTTRADVERLYEATPPRANGCRVIMARTTLVKEENGSFVISYSGLPIVIYHSDGRVTVTADLRKAGLGYTNIVRRLRRYTPFSFSGRRRPIWLVNFPNAEALGVKEPSTYHRGWKRGWLYTPGMTYNPVTKELEGAGDTRAYFDTVYTYENIATVASTMIMRMSRGQIDAESQCLFCRLVIGEEQMPLFEALGEMNHLHHHRYQNVPLSVLNRILHTLPTYEDRCTIATHIHHALHPKKNKYPWGSGFDYPILMEPARSVFHSAIVKYLAKEFED